MVMSLRGLNMVIKWSMGPYSCWLCWAYADCGLLFLMYPICSWKWSFRLQLVGLHMVVCRCYMLACIFHICCNMVCYYQCLVS